MTATLTRPPTAQQQALAAASLVHARDGLATTLLYLAERVAVETVDDACAVLEPAMAALDQPERHDRAVAIADAAGDAHGTWYEGHPDRERAAAHLTALVITAADRVIRVLRYDACVCREVTRCDQS